MKELPDLTPLAYLAFLLIGPLAQACDCALDPTPCTAFTHTAVIFAGQVSRIANIEVSPKSGDPKIHYTRHSVAFDVIRSYRGLQANTVDVSTGEGGGDCGYFFERGREYLVYANPDTDAGFLYTGICQRTQLLSEAHDDIDYLSRKNDPALGAGIEGAVEELSRDAKGYATQVRGFMPGIPIFIDGPRQWKVVTQPDGWFRLWGLQPGKYHVKPVLPTGFLNITSPETVTLTPSSCAYVRVLATPPREPAR
jgi:hypothetical protein